MYLNNVESKAKKADNIIHLNNYLNLRKVCIIILKGTDLS